MQIKSDGKYEGIIHNDVRYIRFSDFDYELQEEFHQWWVRKPLDILTRVRDVELITSLNDAYERINAQPQ
jgi:hypothetical protein